MSASPITHAIVQHLAGAGLMPALKYNVRPKRGCVKTPNIKILNSLCVHLWMRNEFFIFL